MRKKEIQHQNHQRISQDKFHPLVQEYKSGSAPVILAEARKHKPVHPKCFPYIAAAPAGKHLVQRLKAYRCICEDCRISLELHITPLFQDEVGHGSVLTDGSIV